MSEFESRKEEIRQQEKKSDNILMKLNSRAGLIPSLHLRLDDSKIEVRKDGNRDIVILKIHLINVGKEAATNIMLWYATEGKSGLEHYFKTKNKKMNGYFIRDYLNQYYALPRE